MRIITAAIQAIEEHGPDVLTAQIAEQAGVPRTHVYRHFDGKPALDLAVSTQVANEIGAQIRAGLATPGSALDVIGAAIDQHLAWVAAHPNLYRFLAQHAYTVRTAGPGGAGDAKAALAAELSALVQGYLRMFGADAVPVERVIAGVVGMVDATAAWWLGERRPTHRELAEELTEQVWLIIDRAARRAGVVLDPSEPLPALPR